MLTQIQISNLVTIEKLELDFSKDTTVITGETGTGKSILIDAIELVLGGRAFEHTIREGQDKADINIVFDITKLAQAQQWLKNLELDQEDNLCIIRRTINRDGRSKSYINGLPTTLQPLRELSELLINVHGQHEHHSLLKSDKQRDMLDHFATHALLVDQTYALAEEYRFLKNEIVAIQKQTEERQNRTEFLKFQLNELNELNLSPNEFQNLDLEHKQLANAGELIQNLNNAFNILNDEELSISNLLQKVLHSLENVKTVHPNIPAWIENLKNADILLSETENDLQRYLATIEIDPERLNWLDERLSLLFNLARKHRVEPNDLYQFQQKLTDELKILENSDEALQTLRLKLQATEKEYTQVANKLSKSRQKAAAKLSMEITSLIRTLGLPHAEFKIELEEENVSPFASYGLEKIIFKIQTNPGQSMQPLAKIASGGELSRIGLAICIATADQHVTPTLLFDEVDVGISGRTAEIVGKLLRRLGKTHQVICITHLAQVACQAHSHIRVDKITENNLTFSQVHQLSNTEKISEIARLLGGVEITKTTLAHAREMLEKVE